MILQFLIQLLDKSLTVISVEEKERLENQILVLPMNFLNSKRRREQIVQASIVLQKDLNGTVRRVTKNNYGSIGNIV